MLTHSILHAVRIAASRSRNLARGTIGSVSCLNPNTDNATHIHERMYIQAPIPYGNRHHYRSDRPSSPKLPSAREPASHSMNPNRSGVFHPDSKTVLHMRDTPHSDNSPKGQRKVENQRTELFHSSRGRELADTLQALGAREIQGRSSDFSNSESTNLKPACRNPVSRDAGNPRQGCSARSGSAACRVRSPGIRCIGEPGCRVLRRCRPLS